MFQKQRDEFLPARRVAIDDDDLGRTGERELDRHRARRAAGAEHHELLAGRI
ncbi:MAG: hypothetical protein QM739_11695 [Propionivibrio sp.]